jgi:hypothetical protein
LFFFFLSNLIVISTDNFLEWLRLHFQKYIFTCLLTCMFQLMAINNKQNIFLCRSHYIDADYVIIMILTGLSK